MADFVAVIRRAVDGLANNTPEMRAKVYDKARGAVQRQLENMKPRPPEDMLRRQLEKLEAAIVDVESEHAEALEAVADEAAAFDSQPTGEVSAEHQVEETEQASEYRDEQPAAGEAEAESAPAPVVQGERPVFYEDGYEEPAPAVVHAEPAGPEPVEQEPVHVEPPVAEPAVLHEEEAVAEAAGHEEPAAQQYGDWRDDVPSEEPAPYHHPEQVPEPSQAFDESRIEFPTAVPMPASEPVVPEPVHPEPAAAEPAAAPVVESETAEDDFPYPTRGEQPVQQAAPEPVQEWHNEPHPFEGQHPVEERFEVEQPVEAYQPPEPPSATEPARQVEEDWGWEVPAQSEPATPSQEAVAAIAWSDVPELVTAGPVVPIDHGHGDHGHGATAAPVDAHFDAETHVAADTVRMPPVADLPELGQQPGATAAEGAVAAAAAIDPFAEYLDQQQPKAAAAAPAKPADSDPWGDLEELIGFNKDAQSSSGGARSTLHTDADADDLMHAPARPYRVTPVRKRNYAGIVLAIVGLVLVGGGGYAIWMNRDSLNDMVDGLIQSSLPASQTAQQAPAPAPSTPQPNRTPSTPSTPATPSQNGAANTPAPGAPRGADGSAAGSKFTQRLMADGSEVDAGPGVTAGLAQNAEGQSVAQLNAPPANPAAQQAPAPNAPAAPPRAPNGSANAAPVPAQTPPVVPAPNAAVPPAGTPSANPADAPALAGQKIFLYEERIGQTAPTAIDGSVSWSLQREAGANGRQEPVVQGRINVPGRGLTALMTFKRNTDPSLPASHLVEIVFAVPPDFEGGAIESVQRIAMKSSEQDRGNALIAVPAKITDDFHMIALNDFPDARSTNIELLRSRNWIDIPIAYRNGRRALLTLQKGPDGERAFNDAIREWATLGATASGQ